MRSTAISTGGPRIDYVTNQWRRHCHLQHGVIILLCIHGQSIKFIFYVCFVEIFTSFNCSLALTFFLASEYCMLRCCYHTVEEIRLSIFSRNVSLFYSTLITKFLIDNLKVILYIHTHI